MGQATLFLMVGLPGSGKTTRAKELERETGAIRFTPDEWHLFLFGDDFHDPQEHELHNQRHDKVEALMWQVGKRLLAQGASPSEVGAQVGYQDYSTFSRAYKKQFGRGPSADVVHESTICMELGKNCDLQ